MRRVARAWAIAMIFVAVAAGQDAGTAYLVVPHGPRSVVVNGRSLDALPGDTVEVLAGVVVVEQIPGGPFAWNAHRFVDTLRLVAGGVAALNGTPVMEHTIVTKPDGARVLEDGTFLGTTPLRYVHEGPGEPQLTIEREGFRSLLFRPSQRHETIVLVPERSTPSAPTVDVRSIDPQINNATLTIASGILMIASSVGAAVLKEKANKALDRYYATNDPAALDEVRRYDRLSGYASISLQVSFVGFAVFLTSR